MIDAFKPLADAINDLLSQDLALLLPIITLVAFAMLVLTIQGKTLPLILGVVGSVVSAFLFIVLVSFDTRIETYNGLLTYDAFSIVFALIILLVAILVLSSSTLFPGE